MFITEQQLEFYQSQPNHRYYKMPMCNIVIHEYDDFIYQTKCRNENLISLFEYFLHRKLNKNTWQYYFKDNSVLTVTEFQDDFGKTYRLNTSYTSN